MITRKPRKGDRLEYRDPWKKQPPFVQTFIVAETPQGDDTICHIYDPEKGGKPDVPQTWTSFIWAFSHGERNTLFTIAEPEG